MDRPTDGSWPRKGCSEDPVQLPHRTEEVAWQPTPVFWPGESHGQGRLVGYIPWSHRESDTNEATGHDHTHVGLNKGDI